MHNTFSGKMRIFSFISALLVVWIHAYNIAVYDVQNQLIKLFEEFISQFISRCAVPFFFMQSAYFLYDRKNTKSVLVVYRTRFRSIVVPYLIWNVIYMISFALLYKINLSSHGMEKFNIKNILKGILLYEYNYTYWFMLYLIIFTVMYPILRWVISRNRWVATGGIIFLLILYFLGEKSLETFIYYYIGAVCGYYYKENIESMIKKDVIFKAKSFWILLLLSMVMFLICNILQNENVLIVRNFVLVAFVFSAINFADIEIKEEILGIGFMIYTLHPLILESVEKIIYKVLPHNDFWAIVDYSIAPIISVIIVSYSVKILKRFVPGIYAILNGQR